MLSTAPVGVNLDRSTTDDRCRAFAEEVASVCAERGSWRRRLEWVRDTLQQGRGADAVVLGYLGVFLKLVATGAIPCKEDGGHYRPSHHAELGLEIEHLLLTGPGRQDLAQVRGILRWLPSHDQPFRRAEPLTRIRDIAHRNDIPHALKDEIKHTLQNKLHRSAGPEDLQTSAALLARLTAPDARYPEAFVAELRRFHDELVAFFNAGSVDGDLRRLLPELPSDAAPAAAEMLSMFAQPFAAPARIDRELGLITIIRRALQPSWITPDIALGDKLRLVDLKLEERAFLLLGERNNRLEAAQDSASADELRALMAEVAVQLALSGVEVDSMRVIAVADGETEPDLRLLRMRARFETARTVLGWHADRVLAACADFVTELARQLHLAAYVAEQYAAREVRGNLAFQLSRLVDRALAVTSAALGLPPWQAVVVGSAEGRLLAVESLDQLPGDEPTLAVVTRLDGDEEIGDHVRALLVGHDLPHLSHVAIRARQAAVPLAVRRERASPEDWLARRLGQVALVTVDNDGLHVCEPSGGRAKGASRRLELGGIRPTDRPTIVDLGDADLDSCGGKAWGARRLAELARRPSSNFRAPGGFVVPFGAMEACLAADPEREREWQRLLSVLDDGSRSSEWRDAGRGLQRLLETIALPDSLLRLLGDRAAALDRIAIRSSSNAEDRKDAVGAGLFESVIGARPADVPAALRSVWASLYGKRAIGACRAGHAPLRDLRMAVLIQPVVAPELSFVMYTRSRLAPAREAYVELAAGFGETLAGASGEGSPYRMRLDRKGEAHRLTSYLSYPRALVLDGERGLETQLVRFQELRFERDRAWRQALANRLAGLAEAVERELGGPQDVEGAVVADDVWLLQSRPAAAADAAQA